MGAVEDVQDDLQAAGIVDGSTGWKSTRRAERDAGGNQQVIISEDGGPDPEMKTTEGIGSAAVVDEQVQVRVRGDPWDSDATLAKAEEIFDRLHGRLSETVGGTTYHRVRAQSRPVLAGFDDDDRPSHTITFLMLRDG